jgi:hypothetical protein
LTAVEQLVVAHTFQTVEEPFDRLSWTYTAVDEPLNPLSNDDPFIVWL